MEVSLTFLQTPKKEYRYSLLSTKIYIFILDIYLILIIIFIQQDKEKKTRNKILSRIEMQIYKEIFDKLKSRIV